MHPVERSLYVGQAWSQSAENVGTRRYAETDAVHYPGKAHIRFGQHINIGRHPRHDVLKRAFAEITNCPPGARVNQCEHLLTHMRVGAFGDGEVCHTCVERRIDSAVVEVIPGGLHRRGSLPTLVDEWFERSYGMCRLFLLCLALFEGSFVMFVFRQCRL